MSYQNATPRVNTSVSEQLDVVTKEVDVLAEIISQLVGRLSSVTSSRETPMQSAELKSDTNTNDCQVVCRLMEIAARTRASHIALSRLMDSVQL